MTRLYSVATLFSVLICAPAAVAALPQELPPAVEQPAVHDPPAHVSIVDGVAVLERDGEVDDSPANMPLLAGDRVRTRDGRVEILFAGGATLHLDANTTVDFQSDDLIRLLDGRIRLSIPGAIGAISYRVDTPSGWAQIAQPGEYRLAILNGQQGQELELAVLRGGAELLTDAGRTVLRAGERAYARASTVPSSAYVFNSARWDAFDRWSETQRDQRLGVSAQYLPEEVRPYSASFDRYGSWRNDPTHGYVWYPTVSTDWRPYYHGRWVPLPAYGWTWVGRDRWDWPTHHYGRWGFSGGVWFWIPGRTWASAWVSWAVAPDYVSWCPLGWNNRPLIQINVFNAGSRWHPWTVVPRRHFGRGFVTGRAVAFHRFDARTRGLFTYRDAPPEYREYARPRAAAPIRSAGARLGRAVPRGSAPVYTNLGPGDSRVTSGARRVMVPPSAAGTGRARTDQAAPAGARSRAVPRADSGSERPQVQSPAGRQRAGSPVGRAATSPAPSAAAPDGAGRRGVLAAPRVERRTDQAAPGPSRSGARRAVPRETPAAPSVSVPRVRVGQPQPSRGAVRERSSPPPFGSARPSRSEAPPGARTPGRSAPRASQPSGIRAVPRGGAPAARGSSPRPSEARPSGRAAPPQARPAPGPSRGGAPAQARPGSSGGSTQPAARPTQRPSGGQGTPGARPRGGGESSRGTAVPRRRGGV